MKINGLFNTKFSTKRHLCGSIFGDNFFKVIKLSAKLFIKMFLSSSSQNVVLIFALTWGTILKTLERFEKTLSASSAFRTKPSSVSFYTSKIGF